MQKRMSPSNRTWPEVHPIPIPESHKDVDMGSYPLHGLQRSILTGAVMLQFKDEMDSVAFKDWINRALSVQTVDGALHFLEDIKSLAKETVDA